MSAVLYSYEFSYIYSGEQSIVPLFHVTTPCSNSIFETSCKSLSGSKTSPSRIVVSKRRTSPLENFTSPNFDLMGIYKKGVTR